MYWIFVTGKACWGDNAQAKVRWGGGGVNGADADADSAAAAVDGTGSGCCFLTETVCHNKIAFWWWWWL